MSIEKSLWSNGAKKVNLSFPIAKVNKEKRTVSGFATLDNYDRHGDKVLPDASKRAFERFRGNLREMHQPIAVGKILSFNEEEFYDAESGQNYKGIFVNAYISKGAQDTWEKVLDGTLTGFSIGGNIVEASMEPGEEDEEEEVRVIKEYDLHELSLVDSPANPLANIFSIQKSGDTLIVKGMATVETENVFWCGTDQIATSAAGETRDCSVCGDSMDTIGWVEKFDDEKSQAIKKVVDGYFKKDDAPGPDHGPNGTLDSPSSPLSVIDSEDTINLFPDQAGKGKKKKKKDKISKGGNIVENENPEELESTEAEEAVEVVEDGDDAAIEKAADISEVEVDELDFTKMVTDLKDFVGEKLEKNLSKSDEKTEQIQKAVDAKFASVTAENEELKKSIDELKSVVETLQKSLTATAETVTAVVNDTAIKKSGEVDKTEMTIQKSDSPWRGVFFGADSL
jgi:hypothetical protein